MHLTFINLYYKIGSITSETNWVSTEIVSATRAQNFTQCYCCYLWNICDSLDSIAADFTCPKMDCIEQIWELD